MTAPTDRKHDIFAAAEELFLQHGLHGVSLAQVAKRARVPASLICHHYGTKQGLWDAIAKHHLARLVSVRRLLHAKAACPRERLRGLLHAYHLELARDPKLRRFLLWLDVDSTILKDPDFTADMEAGVALVAEAQAAGFLPASHDPRQLLILLLGAVEYPMLWRTEYLCLMEGMGEGAVDAAYLRLLDAMVAGLEAEAKRERG